MKRGMQFTGMVLMSVLAGAPSVTVAQTTQPARPNIVVILADDIGYSDIGCFGSEIRTPHIDSLARQGVAFTQFYNQARCCPTRAALLTGLYPHQVGIGAMIDGYAERERTAANSPAYQDHLSTNAPTMAEVLRSAGYRTYMAGKWHLGRRPDEWPVKRGFDRSFVQINGAMNYYGSSSDGPPEPMAVDDQPFTPPHDGFYSTDAFTDHAVEYIDEASKQSKPFFLYLAYNASHWPLQAPRADIEKYAGTYNTGFQVMREQRLQRMIDLGILPAGSGMAPMDRGNVRGWRDMNDEQQHDWRGRMEVYAAQTDHMDQQIGRVLKELDRQGIADNTLVLFVSDNGGAAEDPNRGKPGSEIGTRDSYRGYGRPWASVSNTPWRRHKVTAYEGGISTPLLVRWPAGIPQALRGTHIGSPGHVIDLMPTVAELASIALPLKPDQLAPEGHSILPLLKGQPDPASPRTYCWEHEGNRAIRTGDWKLVMNNDEPGGWKLYDIAKDRLEQTDLAQTNPEVVAKLSGTWDAWAGRVGVQPWTKLQQARQGAATTQAVH
ncbi:MAG: arylsulfatase [Tepidisphaeraceae bacterium]